MNELQRNYEAVLAELSDLAAAIVAAETDAATARAEADECTSGDGVLAAMAEERAARNRVTLLRRRQAEAQRERNQLSVELERARLAAVAGLIDQVMNSTGGALVDTYRYVIAARDQVESAQRETGATPVDSPLDSVCASLETALRNVGATVLPDTSGSVTVRYGSFTHVRRPIGWQAPVQPKRRWRLPVADDALLAEKVKSILHRREDW